MPQENSPELQPGAVARVFFTPDPGHDNVRLIDFAAGLSAVGAGYAVGQLVENIAFPYNDEYEEHESAIMTAQQDLRDIQGASEDLERVGGEEAAKSADTYAAQLEATIANETAQLPTQHNQTLETISVWGSGILTAVGVFYVARRAINRRAARYGRLSWDAKESQQRSPNVD